MIDLFLLIPLVISLLFGAYDYLMILGESKDGNPAKLWLVHPEYLTAKGQYHRKRYLAIFCIAILLGFVLIARNQ